VMRSRQACYAGPNGGLPEWLQGYARAGTTHLVLRFAGDQVGVGPNSDGWPSPSGFARR
jgi:hypothetical protein